MPIVFNEKLNGKKPIYLDGFKPLPLEVVKAVFNLAEVKKGEKHIELGSGDGRMVVEGLKCGADSIGYEIENKLVKESIDKYKINIINKDCFKVDISKADLITCWFSKKEGTELLGNKLHKEMKIGAKLILVDFLLSKWKPLKKQTVIAYSAFSSKYIIYVYIKK